MFGCKSSHSKSSRDRSCPIKELVLRRSSFEMSSELTSPKLLSVSVVWFLSIGMVWSVLAVAPDVSKPSKSVVACANSMELDFLVKCLDMSAQNLLVVILCD